MRSIWAAQDELRIEKMNERRRRRGKRIEKGKENPNISTTTMSCL